MGKAVLSRLFDSASFEPPHNCHGSRVFVGIENVLPFDVGNLVPAERREDQRSLEERSRLSTEEEILLRELTDKTIDACSIVDDWRYENNIDSVRLHPTHSSLLRPV